MLITRPANSTLQKGDKVVRKATDNKAARMPRTELLSALFECFAEHEYWSMKGLREKLVQPEQYLKEVLEDIAVCNRSGKYVGKWMLKSEYKNSAQKTSETGEPSALGASEVINIDDDDEDDLVEMEDVPM